MAGGLLLIILSTLIFIIALKLIATISKFNKNTTTTTNLPPGPTFISIIGNLLLLRKNLLHIKPMLRHLRAKYGPILSLPLTSHPSILISDRTLIHEALIQKGAVFADRPPGLMTSNQLRISYAPYGPLWGHLRRNLFSEILHPCRIKLFSSTRRRSLHILFHDLQSQSSRSSAGTVVPIDSFLYSMFCLASFMCFGEDVDEKIIREIESVQRNFLVSIYNAAFYGLFPRISNLFFRNQPNAKLVAISRRHEEILIPLIRARRVLRNQTSVAHDHAYVDSLFELQLPEDNDDEKEKRGNRKLIEDEIVSLCSEFITASTETTATSLQWIMANLVIHQEIQAKLFDEIQGVVGSEAEEVKEEELQRMPYLKAVVLEGLRRHPPGHFLLPHIVTKDVLLNGYLIPKGSEVNFTVADIGTADDIWDKPMEFIPERFMEGGEGEGLDLTGKCETKMMPFGIGRRICPGSGLGLLHLEYFVANLIKKFEWKNVDGEKINLSEKMEFTMAMEKPLHARISTRMEV
ncbi:Cytochrome P450 E-class group I protein [Dioscorea alata]|uniref:Cytochrome P450 E-class group I protein n=1 Tax=Dioscorea alata TaxID=55571 RepID=A0ACB7VDC2_DIOAL|nr:Cytochrome P450 E-class group I protein [Dioscorea alata]